ncbi:VOC family protein [Halobacillus salinarum]|uniref:VOC family protein n=1 Tax=Halobacillus salinarum TaxID=2932257 RepID=A0ABY4EEI4_9BACI|nr:VOC family protein [Halobacillus salinarum]UOQ42870.1 VOC family protein [Halobacillus salinarum]
MKPKITVVTLGVENLEKAVAFYKEGLGFPTKGIIGEEFDQGAVAFFDLHEGLKLAVWHRENIASEAKIPLTPSSAAAFTIGHNVASKNEVNQVMEEAEKAGAVITDPAHETFWGGYSGHFQDLDGHVWEVVWNPDFESL